MEVVGGVASLAQLTVLAVQTYKVAAQLTRTYRDAPHELSRVVDRLKILRCELDLLSYLEEQAAAGDELPLLPAEAAALEQALQSADAVIRRIYKSLDNLGSAKMNLKSRMSWALKDKERVEGHLANLQQVDASLGNVLQLVNMLYLPSRLRKILYSNLFLQSSELSFLENGHVSPPGCDGI